MSYPVCPCDDDQIPPPVNLPQLSYISYRVGDYVSFRQAVLTPLFSQQSRRRCQSSRHCR